MKGVTSVGIGTIFSSFSAEAPTTTALKGIIAAENENAGTTDWQISRVRLNKGEYRSEWIEGYCSKQSVAAGEVIDIMVSTAPACRFQLEIYRTGYYGGTGGRLMKKLGPLQGSPQAVPQPGVKNLHECGWNVSVSVLIPEEWVSGVYLGKLTTLPDDQERPYWQSYVIFIVKDERPADLLFQCSDNTWQAYNRWPDNYSVYTDPKGQQGPWAQVSFDRPYGRQAQFQDIVNDPLSVGSGEFISFERPLSFFLEQHGYDVSYCSNSDMLTADRALRCKGFLSVGHDEYWDIRQFNSVQTIRDAGVSLLFFSGNAVCWVSPFSENAKGMPNRRIFRGGPYGADNWYANDREKDHGPFPERGPDEGMLMGVRNIEPINGGGDWTIVKPEHWVFAGTGLKKGDGIAGLVGWEYQGEPADIEGLEIIAAGKAWAGGEVMQNWASVIYPGPKGNFVFHASTIFWAQGLSAPPGHTLPWSHWSRPQGPDSRVQRITHNLLQRAIAR